MNDLLSPKGFILYLLPLNLKYRKGRQPGKYGNILSRAAIMGGSYSQEPVCLERVAVHLLD